MDLLRLGLFGGFSVLLVIFTLQRTHRHRFWRFVAFESLLALIFLQSDQWFDRPFSNVQLISWILLTSSFTLALHGFWLLRKEGAPEVDLEDTTVLIQKGAYRYIRHPLYGSLALAGVGALLKSLSALGFGLLLILFITLYLTAKVEEQDNLRKFGETYRRYSRKTKMFVPFLF